jgi:hypothetical protein
VLEVGDDRIDWVLWEIDLALRHGVPILHVSIADATLPPAKELKSLPGFEGRGRAPRPAQLTGDRRRGRLGRPGGG